MLLGIEENAHWCVNEGPGDLKGYEQCGILALQCERADDPYSLALAFMLLHPDGSRNCSF